MAVTSGVGGGGVNGTVDTETDWREERRTSHVVHTPRAQTPPESVR